MALELKAGLKAGMQVSMKVQLAPFADLQMHVESCIEESRDLSVAKDAFTSCESQPFNQDMNDRLFKHP